MADGLNQLTTRGSQGIFIVKACLQQVLRGSVLVQLRNLLNVEVQDPLLYFDWIFSIEGVLLVQNIEEAAPQRPNIHLRCEAWSLQYQLGSRVVDVTREIIAFEELLEVVRQANRVEFDDFVRELLNSAGVHVSMNEIVRVHVLECENDLVEHIEYFECCEFLFTEGLPLTHY